LIKAIRYTDPDLQMPARKGKLPERQVEDLVSWVRMGLPWPAESSPSAVGSKPGFAITDQDRGYWAFQPVGRPALPPVRNRAWIQNGIDAFILHRLDPSAESGSLLFGSTAHQQEQLGYELALEPRLKQIVLRRHGRQVDILAHAHAPLPAGQPVQLRIEFGGGRVRACLAGHEIALEAHDSAPLPGGLVGVRASRAPLSIDQWRIWTGAQEVELAGPSEAICDGAELSQAAWRDWCLLLLNLNEFAYVD
jgi:hypothetical protein